MKIGLVGWGIEAQSAYRYFGPEHDYLIVNEQPSSDFPPESPKVTVKYLKQPKPPGLTGNVKDLSYLQGLEKCNKIVYSVTSYPNLLQVYGDDKSFWSKATTIQHIFFENVKTQNIIGVTGTKGKGTTSTLIHHMLQSAGKKSFLGGNIGKAVLDFVEEVKPDDWVVLELSNFQLKDLAYSPHIAVCLMINEEHLDWHPHMEDYVNAKSNLFAHQTKKDIAIYFADNLHSKKIAAYSPGKKIPYFKDPGARVRQDGVIVIDQATEIIHKDELQLLGEHNLQNVCAAITAVWQVDSNLAAIRKALRSFSGLEHRLEFVRELDGIKYYDDSFGTTPQTAVVAIRAFEQPKVMIIGGSDKGVPLEPLADEVASANVRKAIVIGQTAHKLTELLGQRGFHKVTLGLEKMPDIVNAARQSAQKGDVILLSTGCASFGLFKDYKDRGDQFKSAVRALA